MTKRSIVISIVMLFFLVYGFSVGYFRIFPFNQLQTAKYFIENQTGQFESGRTEQDMNVNNYETHETVLQRLFLKKIPVPQFNGHGGGIAPVNHWLFLISNKGSVSIFDLNSNKPVDLNLPEVPMSLDQLILSGHPTRNNFKILWFRVNGVHAELDNQENITLFASHNGYDAESDCITHNISKLKISVEDISLAQSGTWTTIFTAEPCIDPVPEYIPSAVPYPGHISGGDIESFSEEELLVTVGDYNRHGIDGTPSFAMDTTNPYGKHILIDKETGEWSIFAIGNRNPSGLHIDGNGLIWSVENGPEEGDELNIITEGSNYGWPQVSYGYWYDPELSLPGGQPYGTHDLFTKPVFSWVPSVAPSSIIRIDGDKFSHWEDDLLVGTMGNQSLRRLRLDEKNRVVYDEQINLGHRIRDMEVLNDNKIVLLTDDRYLIFIEDGGPSFRDLTSENIRVGAQLNQLNQLTGDQNISMEASGNISGRAVFETKCISCHNLHDASQIGPHLNNLFNRTVGGADDYNYSSVLSRNDRKWTPELLESFLKNPDAEFSGNSMQQVQLSQAEIDSVINYLITETKEDQ